MKRIVAKGRSAQSIADSLESAIHAGDLDDGEALPPIRDLAASLKVSPGTVASAYERLRTRGLVLGDGRRGTRVRHSAQPSIATAPSCRERPGLVDLSTGDPDPDLLPAVAGGLRDVPGDKSLYGTGDVPALLAFAKGEFRADGITADDMVVTSGALDAIDRLLREHARPGDRVVVEDPCYPALIDLLHASRLRAEPIALDAEGPRPDALDAAMRRRPAAVVITPRAQNPTGAAISAARASDLRAVLKRHDGPLLIENDPLGPIAGVPVVTLTAGRPQWAVVRSLSKFLGPDLRVAVTCGDRTTISRLRHRYALGPRHVSRILQHLAVRLWADPAAGRFLARAAATYAARRESLLAALTSHRIPIIAPSGFNVWIPVPRENEVVERLAQRGWQAAAGERFRIEALPGVRITTSALEPAAAHRLASDVAWALQAAAAPLA